MSQINRADAFARIIIDISHEKVDRAFSYKVPEKLAGKLEAGMCVNVPFGRGNTLREGYITGLTDRCDFDEALVKEIDSISDKTPGAMQRAVALAWWMKERYGSTMITALKTVIPVKKKVKAVIYKEAALKVSDSEADELIRTAVLKHQGGKARAINALKGGARVSVSFLTRSLAVSPATVAGLEKQGVIEVTSSQTYRNPIHFTEENTQKAKLTAAQQSIVDDFLDSYDKGVRKPALLFGITGSGKTEVYMEMIEGVLARGKQVIVLIPEIALTYQTVRRFYRRFGNVISILNSRMSEGEKYDQLSRVENGEVRIMIGPRSALFTPFKDPGLIIIDEEHETSYKSENMPRFHAREVAKKLCEMTGAALVIGSATPSVDSYYHAMQGDYTLYELKERIGSAKLPKVSVVDLRKELREGNFSMFSRKLTSLMEQSLARGEQVMLFLNRRGVSRFVSCKSCGEVLKCPHCDVSLSEHRTKMVCHYCGYETAKVKACPSCGSPYIYGFKAGTQQVEEKLQKMFPAARILRMDADSTKKKDDYDRILSAFSQHEADILIGTQMIVKGHDFPAVTLVGVLAADLSLFASDHTSSERTFQLLTQAVGRAGRGELPGEAVIQTYRPDHYSVVCAAGQDYPAFYRQEIGARALTGLPPVNHLLAVLILGDDSVRTERFASDLARAAQKGTEKEGAFRLLGPAPACIEKIKDKYRQVVYIKADELDVLIKAKDDMEAYMESASSGARNMSVYFDFDPLTGY